MLTDEQRRIVEHERGHALVRAVPGAGKTLTLRYRAAYLLAQQVPPSRILCVMFNRTPAEAFARALAQAHGDRVPTTRTFHALGYRLTETFMRHGWLPKWRLESSERELRRRAAIALREAIDETGVRCREPLLDVFLQLIEIITAHRRDPAQLIAGRVAADHVPVLVNAYHRFEAGRQRDGVRFYAHLLLDPLECLHRNETARERVTGHLDHIIVDEYQDVNEAQHALLRVLAGQRAAVMAVGDEDQCIYTFRGSRPDYITERFPQDFPGAREYQLTRTFRYGHELALAANHVIARNRRRTDKFAIAAANARVTRVQLVDDDPGRPAAALVDAIRQWSLRGYSENDMAVLVRRWSMSVPVELALLAAGIPYRVESRTPVFARLEVIGLLGVLRLAIGRLGDLAPDRQHDIVRAMLETPPLGLPAQDLARLAADVVAAPLMAEHHIAGVSMRQPMRYPVVEQIRIRAQLWATLRQGMRAHDGPGVILRNYVEQTKLLEQIRGPAARADADDRTIACESLLAEADRFTGSTAAFLTRMDQLAASTAAADQVGVEILTIHRAKGREWPCVAMVGLHDRDFPAREAGRACDLEGERRLFYVGMTRAQAELLMVLPADEACTAWRRDGTIAGVRQSRVTRFVFETNLRTVCQASAALQGGEATGHQVTGRQLGIVARYLRALDYVVREASPGPSRQL